MDTKEPELQPIRETTQPNEKEPNEDHADKTAAPPMIQLVNTEAEKPNTDQTEEETDRKQDESIASLAEQTDWIAKQTKWIKYQVVASSLLGAITLAVLVYHGLIMGRQSQAMSDQTAIMKGQLESMNSGSVQTQQMITAMQKQAEAATSQATTSQALTEQNKDLVAASLIQAEAARQSVGAAQASARAAEKGAQIAQESFYIGDRPYVIIKNFLPDPLDTEKRWSAVLLFSNTGKTPAIDLEIRVNVSVGPHPFPDMTADSDVLIGNEPSLPATRGILGAGVDTYGVAETNKPLSKASIDEIKSGKLFLVVFGDSNYKDSLGKQHMLTFCAIYIPADEVLRFCPGAYNSTN
jgi:hypothetical protein